MNKLLFLMILLSGISPADIPHELIIQHVPASIEIIKQCGNSTQRQSTQINHYTTDMDSYSYSSALSVSAVSMTEGDKSAKDATDCTLTIRTVKPCLDATCRQVIDFVPPLVPSKATKVSK